MFICWNQQPTSSTSLLKLRPFPDSCSEYDLSQQFLPANKSCRTPVGMQKVKLVSLTQYRASSDNGEEYPPYCESIIREASFFKDLLKKNYFFKNVNLKSYNSW